MKAATRAKTIDAVVASLQDMGPDGKRLATKLKKRPLLASFVANTLYARWSAKNPNKADGEFLKYLLDWLKNGGFEQIVKFIAAIAAIFI